MTDSQSSSIIHKKAQVGREDFDARAMSPSKALRLALAKCAEDLFGLALTVKTVEQTRTTAARLPEQMPEDGLLILLDGAGGLRGAVHLDTQMIAALIEAQIIGGVRPNEAPSRSYTRTDAAMAAPFLDTVMDDFDRRLTEEVEAHIPLEMRFGDRVEDARLLSLALEGLALDQFSITSDLGEGAKTGRLTILLPKQPEGQNPDAPRHANRPTMKDTLKENALLATATLDAVLARLHLPLRDICALEPGMRLPVTAESIKETQLFAPGKHRVARVQLGQLNGQRAVRLMQDGARRPGEEAAQAAPLRVMPTEPAPVPAATPAPLVSEQDAIDGSDTAAAFDPEAVLPTALNG